MLLHLVRIGAITAFVLLCTLLPFLPGRYDSLAVPLSAMAQLLGITGLLLVPVGGLWLGFEHRRRRGGSDEASRRDGGYRFVIAALIASSLVFVFGSLAAFVFSGPVFALGALALWACVAWRIAQRLKPRAGARTGLAATPVYLILVPISVVLLQRALAGAATEFSRSRAIRNSAPLIADIERYRAARGHYPPSLLSVNKDYSPGVIGIEKYHYEPSGDAYNLFFEQLSFTFGTREFVVYNPLDQQVMTSHAMDLLQLTPAELEPRRGYYAVHASPHPHWKYFLFD